jgi:hypothetical protein
MSRRLAVTFLVFIGLTIAAVGAADAAEAPALNQKVLDYANSKVGQVVGNGECWTLAHDALDAVGAKRPGQELEVCEFGTVVDLSAVVPDDVLQFEEVNFLHTNQDGSWYSMSFPHHTAIVSAVSGTKITVLNQNVSDDKTVQTTTFDLADRQQGGTITAFEPVSR